MLRYRLTGDQVERVQRPIVGQGGWQSLMRTVQKGLRDDIVSITARTRDRIRQYRERHGDEGGWQARLVFIDGEPLPPPVRRTAVRLLPVAVVARRLGVSPAYAVRLIRRKALTGVRVGRYWRVEPEAVEAFIERHRSVAADDPAPFVDDRQLALFETPDRLALADAPDAGSSQFGPGSPSWSAHEAGER